MQVVTLPEGIADKEALFDAYHEALGTPWRPTNWDGLFDFVCDLSWLAPGDLVIQHDDRPLAAFSTEAGVYAKLVADANRSWAERPEGYVCEADGSIVRTRRTVRIVLPVS